MALLYFLTHPEVHIDPAVPVPQWGLSERGFERMRALLERPWTRSLAGVWSSTEQKARDGALLLGAASGVEHRELEQLGENDRSATGFLPPEEFQRTADEFFARPKESVRGWERAVDAQSRVVGAVERVLQTAQAENLSGDLCVVAHGGVGALLLAHLKGAPISRALDQPGGGGGCVYAFERESRALAFGWRTIEDELLSAGSTPPQP